MIKILRFILIAFFTVFLITCDQPPEEEIPVCEPVGNYRAGVSIRALTPSQSDIDAGGIFMGGYGFLGIRNFSLPMTFSSATGVHDSPYVRAMVIEYDCNTLVFASIDATGIGNNILLEMNDRIVTKTGIPANNIFISATHSHNAPDLQGAWGGVTDKFRELIISETVNAAVEAYNRRLEANIFVSATTAPNHNRRELGYTDDSLNVIDVRRMSDDIRIGTLINFAAHPTILDTEDTELSRDYVGYLVDSAGEELGAPVLFVQGALGDASPNTSGLSYTTNFEKAQAYGELITARAIASMAGQVPVDIGIYHDTYEFEFLISNDIVIAADFFLDMEYTKTYKLFEGYFMDTRVNYVRLGTQVQIATLPGEALTNLSLSIKSVMSAPYQMVFSLTTDSLGYLIPSAEWDPEGQYEETFGFDKYLGDNTRDYLIDMINADSF